MSKTGMAAIEKLNAMNAIYQRHLAQVRKETRTMGQLQALMSKWQERMGEDAMKEEARRRMIAEMEAAR